MVLVVSVRILFVVLVAGGIDHAASAAPAPATSHQPAIRVVQEGGVWWFRDGDGRKFFSVGVNCIGGCYGHAEETPMAPGRKVWIMSLLRDWGFNTAASWSSPSVWNELYVADQIYTAFVPTQHDVFDEAFWSGEYAEHLKREVQPFLGLKNFIGYFLDNEPEWHPPAIFAFYLGLPKDSPGSRALLRFLKAHYRGSLGRLNRHWGTVYASFDSIPGSPPPAGASLPMARGLLRAWRTEVAATYYRRYAGMVRTLDPHHLILGVRYRGIPDMELFMALSPHFDVNSINDYNRYGHLRPVYAALYQASGKPLMITEFSFSGFPHPGQQTGLFIDVYSQARRGLGYHKYMLEAARAPSLVGMHWFMWRDYGQQDKRREGYPYPPDENVGLLSPDEAVVYEELGRWVRRTNAAVEGAHGAARAASRPATPQRRALRPFAPLVDGDLTEWPRSLAINPTRVDSLLDNVRPDHTFYLAWDRRAWYLAGDIADPHLVHPQKEQEWVWEGDQLFIEFAPVKPHHPRQGWPSAFIVYPIGEAPDQQQPYAARWVGFESYRRFPVRVAKRLRSGGFTFEARIPAEAVEGFKGSAGASWKITLRYQNVDGISQSSWEGTVTLRR